MLSADRAKPVKNPEKPPTDYAATKEKINVLKIRVVNLCSSCREGIVSTRENTNNLEKNNLKN